MNLKDIFNNYQNKNKLLLIDGMNLFIRSYTAIPAINTSGLHIGGLTGFLQSLAKVIRETNPSRCIIVFDGKNGSIRRRKIFPEYKSNRSGRPKGVADKILEFSGKESEENMMRQFQRLLFYLEYLPVSIISIDNIEADDVIAYINYLYKGEYKISIGSSDKDFLQLVDTDTSIYSFTKNKTYNIDTIIEEFKIHPYNFALYKSILGDKSDNIPGIKSIGPKTIEKLLSNKLSEEKHISIDEVFNFLLDKKDKKSKMLLENKFIIERNYDLMQLYSVEHVSAGSKLLVKNIIEKQKMNILSKPAIQLAYLKDRLESGIKNINNLLDAFYSLHWNAIKFNKNLEK